MQYFFIQIKGDNIRNSNHFLCFVFQMPLDLSTLTEAERKKRLADRKPKVKASSKIFVFFKGTCVVFGDSFCRTV